MGNLQNLYLRFARLDILDFDLLQGVAQLETGENVGKHILAALDKGRLRMDGIKYEVDVTLGHGVYVGFHNIFDFLDRSCVQLDFFRWRRNVGACPGVGRTSVE